MSAAPNALAQAPANEAPPPAPASEAAPAGEPPAPAPATETPATAPAATEAPATEAPASAAPAATPAPAEPVPAAEPAPTPATEPLDATEPAAPAAGDTVGDVSASLDEPTLQERRLVAYVATGVSVASLITGITFGILAQSEFDCAKDVLGCNAGAQNKIVGEELFDVRSEIEQKALAADMAYLFAAASAVVATVGYLRGFVFVEEDGATSALPPEPLPQPVRFAEVSR